MKTKCSRCGKPRDGSGYYCKKCAREWHREWRSDPANAKRWKQSLKNNVQKRLAWVQSYLEEHPCIDCGEADPLVLQFDHVRGEKIAGVSALARMSIKRAQEEIAKCEVRCANCHLRRHQLTANPTL